MLHKIETGKKSQTVLRAKEGQSRWLGLEHLKLAPKESWSRRLGDEEAVLIVLGGTCQASVEAGSKHQWTIGGRADIFSGPPGGAYIPRKAELNVTALSAFEAVLALAPASVDLEPRQIIPSEVKVVSSGAANWRRDVRLVVPPGSPITQRLIIGETLNPPGNWSGIAPHKHDTISADENLLEEFYVYKMKPADGYGVQLQYGPKADSAAIVGDNDVAFFPDGYHPTVAAPGVTICYLWVIAGEKKDYLIKTDPRFGWVGTAEAVLRELKQA